MVFCRRHILNMPAARILHLTRRTTPLEHVAKVYRCSWARVYFNAEKAVVPNVLESLIGTILSQNTSCRNSTAAKASLDKIFGRNDFAKIVAAPRADLVEALKMGGLAKKKAAVIQSLLGEVKERHGDYSLQHLASLPDDEVMSGK